MLMYNALFVRNEKLYFGTITMSNIYCIYFYCKLFTFQKQNNTLLALESLFCYLGNEGKILACAQIHSRVKLPFPFLTDHANTLGTQLAQLCSCQHMANWAVHQIQKLAAVIQLICYLHHPKHCLVFH